ncbi:MAG: glutaredoxin family protein [Patescibacteria group bacterium]|nr:glutaredoxin family protein [Patescibacteria group bacterium]
MKVKIYTTPTCPYCNLVKDYMVEKGIEYQEINVADDAAAANEMVKLSGQMGVPVIMVNDEVIVGWNKSELEKVLEKVGGKKKKEKSAV